jgi:CheY-like chemotaxis protein
MQSSKNILLVEDDKDDQFFFIEALSQIENAYLYDIANNGKEALHRLTNSIYLPDLIFMDINMPGMNGIECLSEIIKNPKFMNIPVIILTTSTNERALACKIGAKAFIEKPTDSTLLLQKLEQMIHLDFIADNLIASQTFYPRLLPINEAD